jgi:hypothetical protein
MKVADRSNDIMVKRPQPWNVFGRLEFIETRLAALETRLGFIETSIEEIKMGQKMTFIMFIFSQVPVWLMLLKK